MARKISAKFDDLAQLYFDTPEAFARGIDLLNRFNAASERSPTLAEMEKDFFSELDDETDCESLLLKQAFEYEKEAKASASRTGRSDSPDDRTRKLFQEEFARFLEKHGTIPNSNSTKLIPKPLSEAFDHFIGTHKQNWKPNSESEAIYRTEVFPLLLEINGDILTTDLTKAHATEYLEVVLNLPKNRRKSPKYRALSLSQLRATTPTPSEQLSLPTKANYISRLKTLLDWLAKCGYTEPNVSAPLSGVIKKKTQAHKAKNQYTDGDLSKLFNSDDYTKGSHDRPFKYWVPLIGLFTGARENEICQLLTKDIYQHKETGIWVFDFNERDAEKTKKSVKSSGHERVVPIHPQLVKLGLLDFLEAQRRKRASRLFPELPYGKSGRYADKAQKWFNRTYRKRCGIKTPKTSFHSLRHTHINYLQRQLGMRSNEFAHYIGHSPVGNETDERYTKPLELNQYEAQFRKLKFASIDFTKIRAWRQRTNQRGGHSRREKT